MGLNKTTYQLSIPRPCHEDWDRMDMAEKGKFCEACQKNVIDFSKMTDREIVKIIEKSRGDLCGRFTPSQLTREIYIEKYNNLFPLKTNIVAGLLALATLQPVMANASSGPTAVENNIVPDEFPAFVEQPSPGHVHDSTKYKVKGIILSYISDEPVPFAIISIEGTSQGVTADANGVFEIEVRLNDRLKIFSVGYQAQMLVVDEKIVNMETPVIIKLNTPSNFIKGSLEIIKVPEKIHKDVIYNPTEAQLKFFLR